MITRGKNTELVRSKVLVETILQNITSDAREFSNNKAF
jgi:hypothetical protein